MNAKYPHIKVKLAGKDAFNLLGRVKKEMRRAGVSPEEINEFVTQAMSGDYDWLLGTSWNMCRWTERYNKTEENGCDYLLL